MNETLAMLKTNSAGFCIKRDRKTERSVLLKGVIRLPDGISLVVGVEGILQLPFLADEGQLGGGGSGIDA